MDRRNFMKFWFAGVSMLAFAPAFKWKNALAADAVEKITKTNDEWKALLTPEQYDVLREQGTERAFSSPLNDEHREGMFACAGCGLELFPSQFKFDSGTGWPSFYDHIPGHIETSTDYKIVVPRTEYHCARCGGHHGHVFDDGPRPTGLRHCNNGVALKFIPKKA
jgi:peptide-methionine (R)-S-oxide reductase